MTFPVFSQLSRELDLETSSLETASSSRESATNLAFAATAHQNLPRPDGRRRPVPMEQVDLFTGANRTPAYSSVKCFVCCAASSKTGRRVCSPSAEADPVTIGSPLRFVSSPLVTYCGGSGAPCCWYWRNNASK
jgi:hypothetical protein